MKRDDRLRYLSDDHHQALVLARHAERAGAGLGSRSPQEVWAEVVERFDGELTPHFEIEERILLPALEQLAESELVGRTRAEHSLLRNLVRNDDRPTEARLAEFGALLREHVRFEERTLFPVAQEKLAEDSLDAVADACAQSRTARH